VCWGQVWQAERAKTKSNLQLSQLEPGTESVHFSTEFDSVAVEDRGYLVIGSLLNPTFELYGQKRTFGNSIPWTFLESCLIYYGVGAQTPVRSAIS
jgi:hypothetical protein